MARSIRLLHSSKVPQLPCQPDHLVLRPRQCVEQVDAATRCTQPLSWAGRRLRSRTRRAQTSGSGSAVLGGTATVWRGGLAPWDADAPANHAPVAPAADTCWLHKRCPPPAPPPANLRHCKNRALHGMPISDVGSPQCPLAGLHWSPALLRRAGRPPSAPACPASPSLHVVWPSSR